MNAIGEKIKAIRKGKNLKQGELAKKLKMTSAQLCRIEGSKNAPSIKTLARIAKALGMSLSELMEDKQIDENRLAMEVTIFADKVCVDEELTRLRSHIEATSDALRNGDDKDGIGRKLDFLAQEMNREANTILSKSTDLKISDRGISLKTNIEKVREQIQNIE